MCDKSEFKIIKEERYLNKKKWLKCGVMVIGWLLLLVD